MNEERRRNRTARLVAVLSVAAIAVVALIVWLVMLLGSEVVNANTKSETAAVAPALPVGPPVPQRLAQGILGRDEPGMRLQLPIHLDAVTGIGYESRNDTNAIELEPAGVRVNLSFLERIGERLLASDPVSDLPWYQLSEGAPSMVTIGAAPGTDAYAPIDGRIIAIKPYVLDGEAAGETILLQPLGDSHTIVTMRQLDVDPDLSVGQSVSEAATRIGYARNPVSGAESPLAKYTNDSGSGIVLFVTRSSVGSGAIASFG